MQSADPVVCLGLRPPRAALVLGLGLGLGLLLGMAHPAARAEPRVEPASVAVVNGVAVPAAVFEALLASRRGVPNPFDEPEAAEPAPPAVDREAALRDLVLTEVLVQAARQRGLHERVEVSAELALQAKTLLAQQLVRELAGETPVAPSEVEQRYEALAPEREYRVRHVLLPDEAQARAVLARLARGERFETLAKRHSRDAASGRRGGSLGWLMRSQMAAPFAEALDRAAVGRLAAEPVPTEHGWHVVELQAVRELPKPALDAMRPVLRAELLHEKVQARLQALQAQARIEWRPAP